MDSDQMRLQLHEQVLRNRMGATLGGELPRPPYHLRDVSMLYLQGRFDPADVQRIVPAGLSPAKSGWGTIVSYCVDHGWGIAPYTGFFMTVELEGQDGSDGQPGFYAHSGLYSRVGGQVLRGMYNSNFGEGWSRFTVNGPSLLFETGVEDRVLVSNRVRIERTEPVTLNGTSHYVGRTPGADGLTSYTVAWTSAFLPVQVEQLDFLEGADRALHHIPRPLEFMWCAWFPAMSMAFTPPLSLATPVDAQNTASRNVGLLSLFSQLGRAAAIVDGDASLLTLNSVAEGLMRDGALTNVERRLRPFAYSDTANFDAMLRQVAEHGTETVSERIVLSAGNGGSLIAQAISLDPGVAGPGRILVFFDNPARRSDSTSALQLLGLTPAEARVAEMVGGGLSPRETANDLGLTLNTVRSALKVAFEKLGINRQAELARIVARLEQ